MNEELKDYIKQEKDLGTSDEVIKQKLRGNGWTDDLFKDYFEGSKQEPIVPKSTNVNNQQGQVEYVSPKNKKIGVFWLAAPTIGLIVVLMLYSIITFQMGKLDSADLALEGGSFSGLINLILGFLALISTVAIIVGIPIGIVYLRKKEYTNIQFDPRSGKGNASEIPPEIKGWSWGAASLTWIWGLANGVWLAFLIFIPFLGSIWWIVLGINGSKWAWQHSKWISVEEFNRIQTKWNRWGLLLFLLPFILVVFMTIVVVATNLQ